MVQLPIPELPLIPYSQASPAQMVQAMLMAKETLGSCYATIAWPKWQEAFAYCQPLLLPEHNRVIVSTEGLMAIAQYFDARYPASVLMPLLPATQLPSSESVSNSPSPLAKRHHKKTYSLHPDVLESLERVSFWRRVNKSTLVNLAIERLMSTYTESNIPIP